MKTLQATLICTAFGLVFAVTARSQVTTINTPPFTLLPAPPTFEGFSGTPNVPIWNGSFTYGKTTYKYTMAGTDPEQPGVTTTIPVIIQPVAYQLADGTVLDPTVVQPGYTKSPLDLVLQSPIFQNMDWKAGNTDLGVTQFGDAFQRANFWSSVVKNGSAYHVLLGKPKVLPLATVSYAQNYVYPATGSANPAAQVDLYLNSDWAYPAKLKGSLFITLMYNVIYSLGNTGIPNSWGPFGQPQCCFAGYNSPGAANPGGQAVIYASFLDPGILPGVQDVGALSTMIANWMNDPLGINSSPGYFTVPGSASCGTELQPSAPVNQAQSAVTMNGFTYHLPDVAFLSWFERQKPSSAANGWYSFQSSVPTAGAVCQ